MQALVGDLNSDCIVSIVDEQLISAHYQTFFGSLFFISGFDVDPAPNGDLDIDVKDLQLVFGRDGSTCDNPTPPSRRP